MPLWTLRYNPKIMVDTGVGRKIINQGPGSSVTERVAGGLQM